MKKLKKLRFTQLNKYERALIHIADLIENENHAQYLSLQPVLDILGIELIIPKKKK